MYFDNVGGMHFEAAFSLLRPRGRIAVRGGISTYNDKAPAKEQFQPTRMVYSFQRIEGFVCFLWLVGQRGNFRHGMAGWLHEGTVVA